MRKWVRRFWLSLLLLVTLIAGCHFYILYASHELHSGEVKMLPERKVGLVLGTVPTLANGHPNLYFEYRMDMAANAWKLGRVQYLVLSGDNHTEGYDEPEDMRQALLKRGIPDSCLIPDYAGFRTLDSVVRLKAIFGQDSAIVISQAFHNQRAIAIARHYGITLFGANARDVTARYGLKTRSREYLARVKCVLDLFVLNTEPKFYGDPIPIP